METIQENHSENDEVRQRRDFMKTMGKESRHNVISRKDSLILSPDQPPTRIEEAIEVSYLKTVNFDSIEKKTEFAFSSVGCAKVTILKLEKI